MGAHPVMGIVARMNEISLSNHRSRKIDQKIVKNSNLILTMEVAHKQIIEDEFPESKGKVFTVLEYGRKSDLPESLSVPDPTGQDVEDFREFVETAHREADRIRISIMLNGLPESV